MLKILRKTPLIIGLLKTLSFILCREGKLILNDNLLCQRGLFHVLFCVLCELKEMGISGAFLLLVEMVTLVFLTTH